MRTVLIYGPTLVGKSAYGGGVGGYTRNLAVYLSTFNVPGYTFAPLYYTVRGQLQFGLLTPIARFFVDIFNLVRGVFWIRPMAIHALVSPRATPRVFILAVLCRLSGTKLIYDLKAGSFIDCYEKGSPFHRWATGYILRTACIRLVEGTVYIPFLEKHYGCQSEYFPNFVPDTEIPADVPARLLTPEVSVLFVGYCYEGKGVFELLRGCARAARSGGVSIHLQFVGEEEPDFSDFADRFELPPTLRVTRHGRQPHRDVLAFMLASDIYCYPSRHLGEGHNNSINEAMMSGNIILATRAGFLADILDGNCGVFLDEVSEKQVAVRLIEVVQDRFLFRRFAENARRKLMSEFTATAANSRLRRVYATHFGETSPLARQDNIECGSAAETK